MKCRQLGIILILILCFAVNASTAVLGDINGDGKIDLTEALYALQVAAGMYPDLEPSCLLVGKDSWGSEIEYTVCDVVTHGTSLYVCVSDHTSADFQSDLANWVLLSQEGPVKTVTSAGQVWMDRNLGALRVATKSADPDAYGSLYQWGRSGDGHEYRSSSTTSTLSNSDAPGHGSFIRASTSPFDWRSPQNPNLWQGESGTNNPCPAGFRLPTEAEWEIERVSWSSNNSIGAFVSPLKLSAAGYHNIDNGALYLVGGNGFYWSGTVDGSRSRGMVFRSGSAHMDSYYRAYGFSVRCLED